MPDDSLFVLFILFGRLLSIFIQVPVGSISQPRRHDWFLVASFTFQFQFISLTELEHQGKNP